MTTLILPALPGVRGGSVQPPPGANPLARCLRIISAMLLVAVLGACSKMVTLQANLKDAEANEIVLVLNRHGIEVHKEREKEFVTLSVKEEDLSRASAAMTAAGLPKRNLANLGEVFKKQGMISSPMEERVRYIHGLSEELEFTLKQFDRVISARVHVVLPERVAPGEPIQPSSAAVFLKYQPPVDEDALAPRIRNLVASSIPGLSGEDARNKVSVVLIPTELQAPPVEWTKVGPFKVQATSASSLRYTLFALAVMILASGVVIVREMARRKPALASAINKYTAPLAALVSRVRPARGS